MGNKGRPGLGNELADSFCSTHPVIARQFAEATFFSDNRNDLKKLKLPSLLLQCSDDIVAPVQVGEYLEQNLENSTFRVMKATGPCPHMSEPAETISLIRENHHGSINITSRENEGTTIELFLLVDAGGVWV